MPSYGHRCGQPACSPPGFLSVFLKIGVSFGFSLFKPPAITKITESNLVVPVASSLHTCGCYPSGFMDLCLSIVLKYSLIWSCSTKGKSLPSVSGARDCWKELVGTLVFSLRFVTTSPDPFSSRFHISPGMPFYAVVSAEFLLVAPHILHQIQLHMGLAFLTVFLNSQTEPLCSSWVICPRFSSCTLALFLFELYQEFLVHPRRAPATLVRLPARKDGSFLESDTFHIW